MKQRTNLQKAKRRRKYAIVSLAGVIMMGLGLLSNSVLGIAALIVGLFVAATGLTITMFPNLDPWDLRY